MASEKSASPPVRKSRSSEKYKPKQRTEEIEFEVFNDNDSEERIYANNEYEDDQFFENGDKDDEFHENEDKDLQYNIEDTNTNQQIFNNNLTKNSTQGIRSQGPIPNAAQIMSKE